MFNFPIKKKVITHGSGYVLFPYPFVGDYYHLQVPTIRNKLTFWIRIF